MKTLLASLPGVALLLLSPHAFADETPLVEVAPAPMRGWLGLEERNVFGLAANRATQDYGVDILAGAWLPHDHLQPILDLGWSRVAGLENGEKVDTFRAGGRLACGSPWAEGRAWVGAAVGVVAQAGWRHARDPALTSPLGSIAGSLAWAASPSLSALLQGRVARRLWIGGELGIEHSVPPLEWGNFSIFNSFRLQIGLELGVILGDAGP